MYSRLKFLLPFLFLVLNSQAQNIVSVSFNNGAIGIRDGNRTGEAIGIETFDWLQVSKAYFIQTSTSPSVTVFAIQGNDIPGVLRLVTAVNKFVDIPGAIVWTDNGGTKRFIGFIPSSTLSSFNLNVYGGSNYLISNTSNFVLKYNHRTLAFVRGETITGNASTSNALNDLNAYLITTNSSRPEGPVSVNSQTTSSTTPTLTGSVTLRTGENLTVEVNGVVYTTSSGLILTQTQNVSGAISYTWSLTLPSNANLVAGSTYSVRAIITNSSGFTLEDNTVNELNITDPLPVTWLSFTGKKVAQGIELNWSTSSEQNTKDFQVQHSINAQQWTAVGSLPAAGNSNTVRNYRFVHEGPFKNSIQHYYRILQRDLDEKFSYSKVMRIDYADAPLDMILYPNPATDVLHISLSERQELRLVNTQGVVVWKGVLPAGRHEIPVSHFASGAYVLQTEKGAYKVILK